MESKVILLAILLSYYLYIILYYLFILLVNKDLLQDFQGRIITLITKLMAHHHWRDMLFATMISVQLVYF